MEGSNEHSCKLYKCITPVRTWQRGVDDEHNAASTNTLYSTSGCACV